MTFSHIFETNLLFELKTDHTSYLFRITRFGHPEHLHYGRILSDAEKEEILARDHGTFGNTILYDTEDDKYCLDNQPLEYGTEGRGDLREPSLIIRTKDGSSTLDLLYVSHTVHKGTIPMKCSLPVSYGAAETLETVYRDPVTGAELKEYYSVYPKEDVITRRCVLTNGGDEEISLRKMMSFSLDTTEKDLVWMTFGGHWANEMNLTEREIKAGTYVHSSRTGFSSSYANPGSILRKKDTNDRAGEAWGINLVYSGNHYTSVSAGPFGFTRIMSGILPENFEQNLAPDESFETPEAVLCYTDQGLNDLSDRFHRFVVNHIVRGYYKGRIRPILINSWESFYFDVNEKNLAELAKTAAGLGIELFVLDDGWFKNRNDDHAGLGDYETDARKFPHGLKTVADQIRDLGMMFGIWIEPEAVNPDSDLYRAHPEYAMAEKDRKPVFGRNELHLDLTKKEVREYIKENVCRLIQDLDAEYIKWDMNRQMSVYTGEKAHAYILGLYEILEEITGRFPKLLLESCASGGNRFDLGMLCYSPQAWLSDNTDPIERQRMQRNAGYLYPVSAMGAHASASPNHQTGRVTPLSTRFHTAVFGAFGYELDLNRLSEEEREEIRAEIRFYKKYRVVFQWGRSFRLAKKEFYKIRDGIAVCAVFGSAGDNPTVYAAELEPDAEYRVSTDTEECGVFTGKDLMNGVPCGTLRKGEAFTKKDDSVVFVFEKIFTDKV
ncbi:MAG: alpha-galactosidase [Erysipelotrichales bacterium]|nr:alpha-galactosidase [Erysipelotrichales bacterium]